MRSESDQINTTSGAATVSDVRAHVESLRRNGANYDDIASITDHVTFGELKDNVDDVLRYESPGDGVNFGFQALNIDGTPVLGSNGAPTSDGDRFMVSVDMSTVGMAMLQDATLHPLARTAPEEDVAVDSYGALAVSATERIEYTTNIGS